MTLVSALTLCAATLSAQTGPTTRAAKIEDYGRVPLSFELNRGQADPAVEYLSSGGRYTFSLESGGAASLQMRPASQRPGRDGKFNPTASGKQAQAQSALRISPVGANPHSVAHAEDQQVTRSNYFKGSDPSRWLTDVPNFSRVRYTGIYPGIDLVYYGNHSHIEHDFIVAPGSNPKKIALAIDGATAMHIDRPTGDLVLSLGTGKDQHELRLLKPTTYQETNGRRVPVDSSYRLLAGNRVAFHLGHYNASRELVIDPELGYSTYLTMNGFAIALASDGNAYMAGGDVVEKITPGGTAILYRTEIVGESITAIAVDNNGNAYFTGATTSISLATVNPIQATLQGTQNAFIAALNTAGTALLYSTYLGGTASDGGSGIAIDTSNNAYVTGSTTSTDFPTHTPYQATLKGARNAFVTAINASGSAYLYSTYLGGSGSDAANAIAVDATSKAYVVGTTTSTDFPTMSPIQATMKAINGGNAFVTSLSATGTALNYSTYLGGTGGDSGDFTVGDSAQAVALDASANAYVAGYTNSTDFPVTTGAFQTTAGATPSSGFLTKVNAGGASLAYSTYLSGTGVNASFEMLPSPGTSIQGVAVDAQHNAIVTGWTYDYDLPTTPDAYQAKNGDISSPYLHGSYFCNEEAAFLTKFDPTGASLIYSTYMGGPGPDDVHAGCETNPDPGYDDGYVAYGVAVDSLGNAYMTGYADFSAYPTGISFKDYGAPDGFTSKFEFTSVTDTSTTLTATPAVQKPGGPIVLVATVTPSSGTAVPKGYVIFAANGVNYQATVGANGKAQFTLSSGLPAGVYQISAAYSGWLTFNGSSAGPANTGSAVVTVGITSTPTFSLAAGTYASPHTVTLADANAGAVYYYTLNGATPTTSSTQYTGPITISQTETLQAIAVSPNKVASAVGSVAYTILKQTDTPVFSLTPANYTSPHPLSMTSGTAGAVIYYTINGTTPSASSTQYTGTITISKTSNVQAIAIAPGHTNSAVATARYAFVAAPPTFSLPGSTYPGPQTLTITDSSTGTLIYYTTDGSTPTTSSTRLVGSLKITTSETVRAIAEGNGFASSVVVSETYKIQ